MRRRRRQRRRELTRRQERCKWQPWRLRATNQHLVLREISRNKGKEKLTRRSVGGSGDDGSSRSDERVERRLVGASPSSRFCARIKSISTLKKSQRENLLISVASPPRASHAATERARDDDVPVASEIRAIIETLLLGLVMLMKEPQRGDWIEVASQASRGIPTTNSSSLETFPHAPIFPRSVDRITTSEGEEERESVATHGTSR